MEVAYAINERIGGAGIGNPAYHACSALFEHNALKQALALGYQNIGIIDFKEKVQTVVPLGKLVSNIAFGLRNIFPFFPAYTVRDNIFDFCAKKSLQPCTIFHGWNGHCLQTMKKAREYNATTIIERGSTHPLHQQKILQREFDKFGIRTPPIEKKMLQKCIMECNEADYILVNSEFSASTFVQQKIPDEKIICIPRGIDLRKYSGMNSGGMSKKPEQFTALFVGQIGLRKGIQYLLPAWKQLQLRNAKLILAGRVSPDGKKIMKKYRDPSITQQFVQDTLPLYKQASALVLPSIEEGSAKVTFEAMATGIPVITTLNSGSAVRDGKEGFIVEAGNQQALMERMRYFVDNPSELTVFGKRAQKRAKEYSIEKYKQEIWRLYQRLQ